MKKPRLAAGASFIRRAIQRPAGPVPSGQVSDTVSDFVADANHQGLILPDPHGMHLVDPAKRVAPRTVEKEKTRVEAFIDREAHIPEFIERVMMADDPLMAQFQLAGGLAGIRKNQDLRYRVMELFGYAVLTKDAVDRLVPHGPFLEVGAGTGYWSYEIEKAGGESFATDLHTYQTTSIPEVPHPFHGQSCYVPVTPAAAEEIVQEYPEKTLLVVWPEWGKRWAYDALMKYTGTKLVYVGEGMGGRTGDDQWHHEIADNWRESERIKIPQFPYFHDQIFVYERK